MYENKVVQYNNVALKTTNLRLLKTVYYKAIDCAT